MLQIQKTPHNDYVVYDPEDFNHYHTHVKSYLTAKVLKRNVENNILPKSHDIRFIESHMRVTRDRGYMAQLKERVKMLSKKKVSKYNLLQKVMKEKEVNRNYLHKNHEDESLQIVDRFYQILILMIEHGHYIPCHYQISPFEMELVYKSHRKKITILFHPDGESKISYLCEGRYTQRTFCKRNEKELCNTIHQIMSQNRGD